MTGSWNSGIIFIDNFVASQQIRLFQSLKENRFSGQLHFSSANQLEWVFFLYLGRIIYATGGRHPVRRWRRHLVFYLPQIALKLQEELDYLANQNFNIDITWDYDLFCFWVQQKKVSREQANNAICAIIKEIIFDITQNKKITYYLTPNQEISAPQLAMVDSEKQIIEAWKVWQQWQEAGLESLEPDFAPKITKPEKLQAKTSEKNYQVFRKLFDKQHPLRDIAAKKQTKITTLARSIMPYYQLGLIELVAVPDIAVPLILQKNAQSHQQPEESSETISSLMLSEEDYDNILSDSQAFVNRKRKLIACINSSPLISQIMKKVVSTAGYDFLGESEALRAYFVLIERKPDIIFIDLEVPGLTAYELCSQLRQLPYFAETPILLFSRKVGLLDRMKAKVAGFSEIFHAAMESQSILDLIEKYTVAEE